MDSEFTLFIALAAIAFGAALLAVVTQWLKTDEATAAAEVGVRMSLKSLEQPPGPREQPLQLSATADVLDHAIPVEYPAPARPASAEVAAAVEEPLYHLPALEAANPERLSDDVTSLSRLFFGWGTGGMVVGMGLGGAMYGFVGAMLGALALSAATIGGVVVVVALLDRSRARAEATKG